MMQEGSQLVKTISRYRLGIVILYSKLAAMLHSQSKKSKAAGAYSRTTCPQRLNYCGIE